MIFHINKKRIFHLSAVKLACLHVYVDHLYSLFTLEIKSYYFSQMMSKRKESILFLNGQQVRKVTLNLKYLVTGSGGNGRGCNGSHTHFPYYKQS